MVQEFYANLWQTERQRIIGAALFDHKTVVRGKIIHTNADKIREIFKLPQLKDDPDSFNRRMMRVNKGLDKILEDICIPEARWTTSTTGIPNQLKREDLKPVARGWLDFIGHSILPTSNRSEC